MQFSKKQEMLTDIFLGVAGSLIGWLFVSLLIQPAGNSLTFSFFVFAALCSFTLIWIGRVAS